MSRIGIALIGLVGSLWAQPVEIRRQDIDPAVLMQLSRAAQPWKVASTAKVLDFSAATVSMDRENLGIRRLPDPAANRLKESDDLDLPFQFLRANPGAAVASKKLTLFMLRIAKGGTFTPSADGGYRYRLQAILEPLEDTDDLELPTKVEAPVQVRGGRADPGQLVFEKLKRFEFAELTVISPDAEVEVTVSVSGADDAKFLVPVFRATPSLTVSPAEVLGFGLGTATIRISGEGLAGKTVALAASQGSLEPSSVVLDSSGNGTVLFRSAGRGRATVSIASRDLNRQEISLGLRSPWIFVLWALAGGILMTSVRLLKLGNPFRLRPFPWWLVAHAVLSGLLGAILWAVGLKILTVDWSPAWSEAAAFVVSALTVPVISLTQRKRS